MSLDPQHALRILCGVWFAPHIALKIKNANLAQETFAKVGLKPGRLFLWVTILMEALAGVGLALDYQPRIAAGLGVFVLMGASYAVLRLNGLNWRWNKGGPEFMLFWSLAIIVAVA